MPSGACTLTQLHMTVAINGLHSHASYAGIQHIRLDIEGAPPYSQHSHIQERPLS